MEIILFDKCMTINSKIREYCFCHKSHIVNVPANKKKKQITIIICVM